MQFLLEGYPKPLDENEVIRFLNDPPEQCPVSRFYELMEQNYALMDQSHARETPARSELSRLARRARDELLKIVESQRVIFSPGITLKNFCNQIKNLANNQSPKAVALYIYNNTLLSDGGRPSLEQAIDFSKRVNREYTRMPERRIAHLIADGINRIRA